MKHLFIIIAAIAASLPATLSAQQAPQDAPQRQNWSLHALYGDVARVTTKVYRQSVAHKLSLDSLSSWDDWSFNERGDVALHASGNSKAELTTQAIYTYNTEGYSGISPFGLFCPERHILSRCAPLVRPTCRRSAPQPYLRGRCNGMCVGSRTPLRRDISALLPLAPAHRTCKAICSVAVCR